MQPPFPNLCVTGASRGLGAALARRAAAPGVRLRLIARGAAGLAETAEACRASGAEAETACLDIRDAAALAAQLESWDRAAPLDLLIANAGVTGGTPPGGGFEGWESAERVIATNLLGAINTVEPILPRMAARGAGQIGLIASIAAFRGLPDSPAYCASKAGLRAYGESLRARLAKTGVGVSVIQPGFFASDMSARFDARHLLPLALEDATERCWRAFVARRGRATFPWAAGALLRLLDLLPAPLADAAVRRYRFTIRPE